MESIDIIIKVKVDMSWIDVMKLRLAGLSNILKLEEESK